MLAVLATLPVRTAYQGESFAFMLPLHSVFAQQNDFLYYRQFQRYIKLSSISTIFAP